MFILSAKSAKYYDQRPTWPHSDETKPISDQSNRFEDADSNAQRRIYDDSCPIRFANRTICGGL